MKTKPKTIVKRVSQVTEKVAKKKTARRMESRPIPTKTAATYQDMFVAALGELVEITGDMRGLLIEIRDLLAEGAEQEAEEGQGAGVEAVILAETEPEEDLQ